MEFRSDTIEEQKTINNISIILKRPIYSQARCNMCRAVSSESIKATYSQWKVVASANSIFMNSNVLIKTDHEDASKYNLTHIPKSLFASINGLIYMNAPSAMSNHKHMHLNNIKYDMYPLIHHDKHMGRASFVLNRWYWIESNIHEVKRFGQRVLRSNIDFNTIFLYSRPYISFFKRDDRFRIGVLETLGFFNTSDPQKYQFIQEYSPDKYSFEHIVYPWEVDFLEPFPNIRDGLPSEE